MWEGDVLVRERNLQHDQAWLAVSIVSLLCDFSFVEIQCATISRL